MELGEPRPHPGEAPEIGCEGYPRQLPPEGELLGQGPPELSGAVA